MSENEYVSFENARLIVFWTKNPVPIMGHLDEIDKKKIGYYFQYTLTDYSDEGLEANMPSLENRITIFKTLSDMIGPEKVIWRFDPLVLTDTLTRERLVDKVKNLMEKLTGCTEKLVISFFKSGEYDHALKRMQKSKMNPRDFKPEDMAFVADELKKLGKKHNMKVATCAENDELLLLSKIDPNKCIDDELIKRVFKDDKVLMSFLNSKKDLKHGMRKGCECIVSTDIGKYNTCANKCQYCYANKSDNALKRNLERIENGEIGEFLVPPPKRSEKSVKKNSDRISQKGEKRRSDLPN
jgi:DNA repair photolyase